MKIISEVRQYFELNKNVMMVGITGSLAMVNASDSSDIDLMVIAKKGRVWTTRLEVLTSLIKHRVATRRAEDGEEKDKLCLNIWLDETDLCLEEKYRNPYTAHELAQIIPIVNKESTYEKLLASNSWLLDYWPNSVQVTKIQSYKDTKSSVIFYLFTFVDSVVEKVAYTLQRMYMRGKRTSEIITPTRAFFHPFDWSKKVTLELRKRGVEYV
jgi:D-beta-D-heptose 7-phosphate kinase/D-beta-D-heptose 1-phosphate adenosyltransferase